MVDINDREIPEEFKIEAFINFLDKLLLIQDENTPKRQKVINQIKEKIIIQNNK